MFSKKEERLADVMCLARRIELLADITHYNSTLAMGDKYQEWIDKFKKVIDELYVLIKEDIKELVPPPLPKIEEKEPVKEVI